MKIEVSKVSNGYIIKSEEDDYYGGTSEVISVQNTESDLAEHIGKLCIKGLDYNNSIIINVL